MSSDAFRHRARLQPAGRKCSQCGIEKAHPGRPDGRGMKCGKMFDETQTHAREHAARVGQLPAEEPPVEMPPTPAVVPPVRVTGHRIRR